MARFKLVRHLLASTSGGGGGTAIYYDNRFGTDTVTAASTGWFTFDLHSGNRRVWVDATNGNDTTGNGLSAATAKKTFAAAMSVFSSGFTAGDQLMLAGTGGRSYTDPGSVSLGFNFTGYAGISKAYPVAVLCYDPAAPADSTKYGKLLGSDRPVLDISSVSGTTVFRKSSDSTAGASYFAMQGIIVEGNNVAGPSIEYTGRQDGMAFQNCTFRAVEILFNNASSSLGFTQDLSVTKCAFYGAWWTDGNSAGLFDHGTNNLWVTDCAFLHCAWKIGASRDDTPATGGTHKGGQGHGHYHHATSTNARFMRNVYGINSADGYNARGDVVSSDIVAIDEPIAITVGGFSDSVAERPNGQITTIDNFLVIGGSNIDSSTPRALGFNLQNTLSGSYARNGVMIENPYKGLTGNYYMNYGDITDGSAPGYAFLLDNIRGYNYSTRAQGGSGLSAADVSIAWTNNIIDVAPSGWNDGGASTNNSISSGATFPLKKTPAQIYTAMGYASRNAMFDAIVAYPHLPWAQALISIGLPAYGLSSTTAPSISPPDISGLPAPTTISWGS